ncbi:MAG TPA: glycosyltransferase family A protein, partial [Opitutales bacterium]|nr:glycosyltransferase family A protein [Opitutales bacterium]
MTGSDLTAEVAVVIPVYNRPTILLETLECVFRQTLLPRRVIVVDDGSTDNTADSAEAWLRSQDSIVETSVIRLPKSTAAAARNAGFKMIGDVEYLAFLDSDDHWPTDFLERCVSALSKAPDAVAAITDRRYQLFLDEPVQTSGGEAMVRDPVPWMFEHGAGIASCSLIRREIAA